MAKNFFTVLIEFFKSLFTSKPVIEPEVKEEPPTEIETPVEPEIMPETIEEPVEKKLELGLERIYTCKSYTIGHLYINGEYFCDTIEDTDRGFTSETPLEEIKKKKVYGETAIPTGTYEITMNTKSQKYSDFTRYRWAEKYDGYLPRLLNVPGFDGVLIHVGNYANPDSYGCILVGFNKSKGMVSDSTTTFKLLMDKYMVPAREEGTKIYIKISTKY